MKLRTRWKKCNIPYFNDKNKEFFNDDIGGWFKILKIQNCKKYCKSAAETIYGSHWTDVKRVSIKTRTNIKYVVPYIWLICNSVTKKGNYLYKVLDGVVNEEDN